jgi:NAD(P)-dependent dehydrogenase (short-subunit alcohol dehydrogenase family)
MAGEFSPEIILKVELRLLSNCPVRVQPQERDMHLQGKTALITGAGKRIGRAIALTLAESGADILLHVHTSSGEKVAREIEARGRRIFVLSADLSTTTGAQQLEQGAIRAAGHVDVLVNSAAVFSPTPLAGLSASSWRKILQTNLTSPFILALRLGRRMRERGEGKIIQLADWSGIRPTPGFLPYCVTKSGSIALTQALAKALAPQVQVNAVAPGPVLPPENYSGDAVRRLAEQTPLRRIGHENDVARAVRFLAETADYVTGSTYMIDGGWLAKVAEGSSTSL